MTKITAGQMLEQLRQMEGLAKSQAPSETPATSGPEFGSMLKNAIDHVNDLQKASSTLATQVESGDGGASLVKAMIASQKSSVAFQATLQVRNKLVSAYQDIMNMPI